MFLDEIAAHLVSTGVGTVGVDIFRSSAVKVPVGNGPYLSIIETGGTGSSKTQNNTATERPSAQLLCRASNYLVARAMLVAAYNALGGADGLYNVTLSGVFYISITAKQNPTDLGGLDEAGRSMLSFNIDVEKYPS